MGLPRTDDLAYVTRFPSCAKAITPHDTNPLTNFQGSAQPQMVIVNGAGDVVVVPAGNDDAQTITYTLTAGSVVPVICRIVKAAGTTATGLVGHF